MPSSINVILGYIALIEEGIYGPVPEKQAPVIKTIEAQANTLARLAAQLLDVSRFEAGGGRIRPMPVPVSAMVDGLARTFHLLPVPRDLQVTVGRKGRPSAE